jgi:predicted anti-sigma-YlaC factor YlaD
MSCQEIENALSLYLDGEMSSGEKALLEKHLQACPGCARLLSYLQDTKEALSAMPELEVSERLMEKLYSLPREKRKWRFSLDFLVKPSLQPVFAVATVFFILFSFYFFNPDRKLIDRSIDRQVHIGLGKVEKLYAKTGSFTDSLGEYKDNVLGSFKNLKFWGKSKGQE